MELLEAIKSRKSIRGYRPTPVPKEILTRILEIVTCALSNIKSPPWDFPANKFQSTREPLANMVTWRGI